MPKIRGEIVSIEGEGEVEEEQSFVERYLDVQRQNVDSVPTGSNEEFILRIKRTDTSPGQVKMDIEILLEQRYDTDAIINIVDNSKR